MKNATRWALGALVLVLGACGGGGGGGGGPSNNGLRLTVDSSRVDFTVLEGATPGQGAQTVTARLSGGNGNESVFIGVEATGQGVLLPIGVTIDTVARTGVASVAPNAALAAGTYNGTLRVLACLDAACNSPISGSPFTINYGTTVQPRFKASVGSLAFAAAESVQAAAKTLTLTLPSGVSAATHTVRYGSGATGWLQVDATGSSYSIRPGTGLAAGSYNAQIDFDAGSQPRVTVDVQHVVSAGLVLAPLVEARITSTSPASANSGSVAVDAAPGVAAGTWTASTASPWLRLASTTGALGTPLQWSIDPEGFRALPNGASTDARVTVTAGALTPQVLTLRLNKDVAEFQGIDTLAVLAGEAGEVLIHGRLLDEAGLQQRVVATGFTPGALTVRSPKLLSLQVGALAAGSYTLTLPTASGLPTRSVQLQVLAPVDRGAQVVATTGIKGGVQWDPITQSLFVHNISQSSVMRFQLGGSVAQPSATVSSRVIAGLMGIALSPDRRSVIAITATGTLLRLSTQDLSTQTSTELGRTVAEGTSVGLPLVVTGDQRLLMSQGSQFAGALYVDLETDRVLPLPTGNFTFYSGPWGRVSPNGQRALIVQTAGLSPAPPLLRRDAADGLLSPVVGNAPSFFYRGASDRRGTRWVLDGRVYTYDMVQQGMLQPVPPDGWFGQEAVMSRDGSRTYLYTRNAVLSQSRIFVLDTGASLGTGYIFPSLGTLEPWLEPSCSNQVQNESCNGYATRVVLTDDDRTLLLIGDRQLAVVPIPANLRGGPLPATAQGTRWMGPARR
ncbi:hypothetical protein [Rubrivivax rivuli]|uniref:BACON domain-containing protein n=1 Tax=Rubrivivax rivuli TaxID=1862385 RepID=A0A437RL32_9BURK|nr:hypothetical protein [Rubrivivax rivuli]RVU47469.1 hypothetical protein EOE66_06930 [Rubrivivax rivuli]